MSVVPEPSVSARRTRCWSNRSGVVEPGRAIHRHLRAEAAVAEVRPVADFAVADAHEVGQAVARHVGEVDRLRAVGEHDARALALRRAGSGRESPAPKPSSEQRRVPGEGVVLGDQNVGDAVAGQVDEPQVRIVPVEHRQRAEGAERPQPASIVRS